MLKFSSKLKEEIVGVDKRTVGYVSGLIRFKVRSTLNFTTLIPLPPHPPTLFFWTLLYFEVRGLNFFFAESESKIVAESSFFLRATPD